MWKKLMLKSSGCQGLYFFLRLLSEGFLAQLQLEGDCRATGCSHQSLHMPLPHCWPDRMLHQQNLLLALLFPSSWSATGWFVCFKPCFQGFTSSSC